MMKKRQPSCSDLVLNLLELLHRLFLCHLIFTSFPLFPSPCYWSA